MEEYGNLDKSLRPKFFFKQAELIVNGKKFIPKN